MDIFVPIFNTLIFPIVFGFYLIGLLDNNNHFPFSVKIALGYGLGLGCVTQWMLILSTLNIPLSFPVIILPLFIIMIFMIMMYKRRGKVPEPTHTNSQRVDYNFLSIMLISYILLCLAFILWRTLNIPLSTWDAFSYNGFVAKAIYFERSLYYLPNMPHYEYPLHATFMQVWASLCLGDWNDLFINVLFPFYLIFFLIFFFYFITQYTSSIWALFGLALIVSSNLLVHHASIAYRDITLMYYINVSLLLLLLSRKDGCRRKLFLSGLMAGIATSVKLDATGYVFVLTLIMSVIFLANKSTGMKQKLTDFLAFTIPCYSILLFFNIYKMLAVEPRAPRTIGEKLSFDLYSVKFNFGFEIITRFKTVLLRIMDNLFLSGNWGIVWLIFLISLTNIWKKKGSFEVKILVLALIAFFGLQIAGYTFTQYYYWIADTHTSLSRHLLSHFPVVVALIIFLNGQKTQL